MTRLVFCRKYQQQLEGLERAPYPGAKGLDIFNNVSQKAWQEWLSEQTRLINEKHLSMLNPEDRKFLNEQMQLFLADEDFEQAAGFVPVKES